MEELISKVSGNEIVEFVEAISLANGPTFSFIKTKDHWGNYCWELYLCEGTHFEIDKKPENFVVYFAPHPKFDSYNNNALALRWLITALERNRGLRSDISNESIQALKDYYNDYYKYELWFEKLA